MLPLGSNSKSKALNITFGLIFKAKMGRLSKLALKAILPVFILAKAVFPSDMISIGYGSENSKSKLNLLGSFNENPILYVGPGNNDSNFAAGFKFNIKDFEFNPSASYQKMQAENASGKEESSSVVTDLRLEKRINDNLSAFGQITSINEPGSSTFFEKTTNIENLADNTVPYNYTVTTDVENIVNTSVNTSALNYRLGLNVGENIEVYAGQNSIGIKTDVSGRVDTEVTLDGTIAGTDIYQVSRASSSISAQNTKNISETVLGGNYYFSADPLLAKIGVRQNISSVSAEASNSSLKAELKMIFPIGFSEDYFSGSDYKQSEKEINKYENNYVYNDAIDGIVDLKQKDYRAIVTSFDTDGNIGLGYIQDKFRGKLQYLNKGDISLSLGYKAFDAKATKTKEGLNYAVNFTAKID